MNKPCKYCLRMIDIRGMQPHIYFRHRRQVLHEFRLSPWPWFFNGVWPPPSWNAQKLLPATTTQWDVSKLELVCDKLRTLSSIG